ncbi:hypothetical protein N7539_001975 [Penicillium diatomitis]|uniref:Uncharacterized protein n=1 Tax=Penicillium diatomitis TaxID=2819901 RepID=A0A9W9XHY4_9EURO|nr:uncharacterized protein N7539_001975 [Penicillium diatomitis]KAJ5493229.1 hypothetical protein N7539_001975 [Penicillium diatomitis]
MATRLSLKPRALRIRGGCPQGGLGFCSPRRQYASATHPPFAFTWLTKSPEAVNPHDILSSIPSLQTFQYTSNPVPLLLVTPKFAHWLNSPHEFLRHLVQNVYTGASRADRIYAVAAVVDKIPSPSTPIEGGSTESTAGNASESEGLSLLVIGEQDIRGKPVPPRRFGGPADEETDLSFSFRKDQTSRGSADGAYQVGLRLANTIFVNGKESTLFGMQWQFDKTSDSFTLDRTIDLTSCAITSPNASGSIRPRVTLPLHPIGERKRVLASMGNILRQISKSTDPASNDPIPASSDLEKILPQYIKDHNVSDHRVSVWALVGKPHVKVTDSSLSTREYLAESLRQGGKLHRVVSGGGGWGKKQGLLSLDPEVCFFGSANRGTLPGLEEIFNPGENANSNIAALSAESLVGDDLSLLSQVATSGDYIQFFVARDPSEIHDESSLDLQSVASNVTFTFGMVSHLEESSPADASSEKTDLEFVPNVFGALSEKAISFNQPVAAAEGSSESSTKLNISGCRVRLGW